MNPFGNGMPDGIHISKLYRYSLGMVAENKARDTKIVECWPIELMPDIEGELNTQTTPITSSGVDSDGELYQVTVKRGDSIPCEWLGRTNCPLAPDVRRGEEVTIYRLGDSNKFYWVSNGRDDNLRRLETQRYEWNAFSGNEDITPGQENTYSIEVSSHEQHITLHTSMANGEKAGFTTQYNMAEGTFTLEDEKGNYLFLDSVNTIWELRNKDESFLLMDKTNITMRSKDTIHLETTDFSLKADTVLIDCVTYTMNATDATTTVTNWNLIAENITEMATSYAINTATYDLTASGPANITASVLGLNAGGITMAAPGGAAVMKAGSMTIEADNFEIIAPTTIGGATAFTDVVTFAKGFVSDVPVTAPAFKANSKTYG